MRLDKKNPIYIPKSYRPALLGSRGGPETTSGRNERELFVVLSKSMDLSDVIPNIHRRRIFLSSAFTMREGLLARNIGSNWEICKSVGGTNEHVRYRVSVCQKYEQE